MAKISISIIIPNRNYAKYVADAITSVRTQSITDWECIIIDDASTDNSVQIIRKSIYGDKRFKLIEFSTPVGVSRARNAGLDIARGEYIAFLDSDDCYTEYALEMLLNLAKTMDAPVVGGQAQIVPADFKFPTKRTLNLPVGRCWFQSDLTRFLIGPKEYNWCWVWRRIYKTQLLKDIRFIPECTSVGDDLGFMLDLCWRTNRVVETENIVVYHRYHNKSIMHNDFSPKFFLFFPAFFKRMRTDINNKYDSAFLKHFYLSMFNYLILETVIRPKRFNKYQAKARAILLESSRLIPLRYLPIRKRILCWFLSCLK